MKSILALPDDLFVAQCHEIIAKDYQMTVTGPDYALTGRPIAEENARSEGIRVYTKEEISKIRHACVIGREILDIAGRFLRTGVTGNEIDKLIHNLCVEKNAYPSPLNYYGFPKSVCISHNEVICHGIPDSRVIKEGDIINIDVSVCVNGFHADLNETFMMTAVDEDSKRLVQASYMALQAASRLIKPGTFYRDLGPEITKVANNNKCSVVRDYSGHGVGAHLHCNPIVPHYAHNKAIGIMKPGHVFTIEPMLNLGLKDCILGADKWTVTTKDGKRSSQFEHTFLVTETGCEILTAIVGSSRTKIIDWDPERYLR